MKIKKVEGPPPVSLRKLKVGDLFERADVKKPGTTYLVARHDNSVKIDVTGRPIDCSFVFDLVNSTFKAMDDDTAVMPLEQFNEIVVREI